MASVNKGHYEPCWVPVGGPFRPPPRRQFEEVFQKMEQKHKALENALEWIEMRCDTKEFPSTYYLIKEALDA